MNTPSDTVNALTSAINRGDLDAALALYEAGAVLLPQPGTIARGTPEIRQALGGFIALKPTLKSEAQHVVEVGDLALYLGRWTLRGTDPTGKTITMEGKSTDLLRRQANGRWLIALDNPWGTQLLG